MALPKSNEQDFVGIFFRSFLIENGDLVESSDWDVNANYMDDDSQGNSAILESRYMSLVLKKILLKL